MVQANRQSNVAPARGGTTAPPPRGRQAAPAAKPTGFNLNPDTFTQGGLLDDVDVTIKQARFVMYDYNGKMPEAVLALELVIEDADGNEEVVYQAAGKETTKSFDPSEDGLTVVPKFEGATMKQNSNLALFLQSLRNAGFPDEDIQNGMMDCLDGLNVHVRRVTQERKGMIQTGPNAGKAQQTLLVENINSYPGESPAQPKRSAPAGRSAAPARPTGGRGAQSASATPSARTAGRANGKAAAAQSEPAEVSQEVIDKTIDLIGEVLAKNNGQLAMAALSGKLFQAAKSDPDREAIVNLAWDQEFLGSSDKWSFDGATISL
jgi:hypothetical protein